DFCNECGNCDVFCPEEGGPYKVKPRFFGSRETFDAIAPEDAIFVESPSRVLARIEGVLHELVDDGERARFTDGVVEVTLDRDHRILEARLLAQRDAHVLPLWRYHALRVLRDATLAGKNPVSAAWSRRLSD